MERKIGEVFARDGVTLEVVESEGCKGCHLFKWCIHCDWHADEIAGECGPFNRSDHTSVIFKKVE